MTPGVVVFARTGSQRLLSKAFADIAGRPLLGHVVDRAQRVPGNLPVVVATSNWAADDAIEKWCEKEGVEVFRGDLDDVAGRAIACCAAYGFDRFARVCGDRPFHDPDVIALLFDRMEQEALDLATNMAPKTFPAGLTAEVVLVAALSRALASGADTEDREHLTRYFYRAPAGFRIGNVVADPPVCTKVSLVVDTERDLERIRWIADRLLVPATAPRDEIVALASQWEALHGVS